MVKPGAGSRLLRLVERNPIYAACVREVGRVRLAVTGPFADGDLGVACYHSKVGAVELLLNHLVDGAGEYLVVDMTAGADSFASGLFTRFDVMFLVCEPTLRSVGVYRQYRAYAKDFGVRIAVVGNKVCDEQDATFLREHIGGNLVGWVSRWRPCPRHRTRGDPSDQCAGTGRRGHLGSDARVGRPHAQRLADLSAASCRVPPAQRCRVG